MTRHSVLCRNPACQMTYFPDKDHRYNGCCSAICARAITPRTNVQRTVKGEVGIVISRAPINRKFGADNRKRSDE